MSAAITIPDADLLPGIIGEDSGIFVARFGDELRECKTRSEAEAWIVGCKDRAAAYAAKTAPDNIGRHLLTGAKP